MTPEFHRDLRLLEAIAEDQGITQRRLAGRLGIALGLANLYLQRLARKGYIKCVSVQPNRLRYLLTPKGAAEKMRLTYEFMEYSLSLYRQVRQHLRERLEPISHRSPLRVAICGTGEAAELAYLSLREMNIEPAAILGGDGQDRFLGLPVMDVHEHPLAAYDLIVAATLELQDEMVAELIGRGVPAERIVTLRAAAHRPPPVAARPAGRDGRAAGSATQSRGAR